MISEVDVSSKNLKGESHGRAERHIRPWMKLFLTELEKLGNLTDACRVANISQRSAYAWKSDDKSFAEAWEAAIETAIDNVERKGMQIAAEGYQRPIYRDGAVIAYESIHDPRLIEFFLKTRRRSVYGDKVAVEVTGALGLGVVAGPDLAALLASVVGELPPVPPPMVIAALDAPKESPAP